jgi:hypothetical protein
MGDWTRFRKEETKMRRTLLVLLSVVVLGITGSQTVASDDGFGDSVAGVWFGNFEFAGGTTPFIQRYNADGTAQTSSTNPATSIHHVTWEKTGAREISWRLLHFNFNDQGLTFISRTYGFQRYDKRFEEFTGEFTVEVCPCVPFPFPLDPLLKYDCSALLDALWDDPNADVCVNPPLPPGTTQGKRMDVDVPLNNW